MARRSCCSTGCGSSRNDWALQLPAFVPQFRTVAVDLRGMGSRPNHRGRIASRNLPRMAGC